MYSSKHNFRHKSICGNQKKSNQEVYGRNGLRRINSVQSINGRKSRRTPYPLHTQMYPPTTAPIAPLLILSIDLGDGRRLGCTWRWRLASGGRHRWCGRSSTCRGARDSSSATSAAATAPRERGRSRGRASTLAPRVPIGPLRPPNVLAPAAIAGVCVSVRVRVRVRIRHWCFARRCPPRVLEPPHQHRVFNRCPHGAVAPTAVEVREGRCVSHVGGGGEGWIEE